MDALTVPTVEDESKRWAQVFWRINRKVTTVYLTIFYFVALLATYLTLVAPGASYTRVWLNDEMGVLDVANRVRLGEVPYKEFHFFYGPFVAMIPAFGLDLGFSAGAIFGFDSLVISALLLMTAVVALPRRFTAGAAAFVFLFVWMLIATPLGRAEIYERVSWGGFYSRQGWAALCLLLAFYIEPEGVRARDKWLDAAAIAALVLFEIYTKFTFGMVALGFLIANALVSRYNRQVSFLSLVLIVFVAVGLELRFHFHAAYWRDIMGQLALLKSDPLGRWTIVSIIIENGGIISAGIGAALLTKLVGRRSVFDSLYLAGCILAAVLLEAGSGEAHTSSAPTLVAIVAVIVSLGELARRAEFQNSALRSRSEPFLRRHTASLACLLLAGAFAATEMGNRLVAWEDFTAKVLHARPLAGAPAALADFIVPDSKAGDLYRLLEASPDATVAGERTWFELGTTDYLRTIIEGVQLLHAISDSHRTVFTFDMVNPFPYAAGMKPPPNGYPLFWVGTPFSDDPKLLPSPTQLLGRADIVMVPRLPYTTSQLRAMIRIYGPYLKQNYTLLKQSPHWQLWVRNADVPTSGY